MISRETKIERLGLAGKCMKMRGEGVSIKNIAKNLEILTGEDISKANVSGFLNRRERMRHNTDYMKDRLKNAVVENKLKVLGNWKFMDDELKKLMEIAGNILAKYEEDVKGFDISAAKLLKDVIQDIAKTSESRARVLGQIVPKTTNITYNIENQYNDFKQLVIEAEQHFPGLAQWIEDKMFEKNKK